MEALQTIVHSLVIPMQGKPLLLPNAAVAELIAYRPTEALDDAPDWLLGIIDWRGHRIPVVSMEDLLEGSHTDYKGRLRIVVFNSLSGDSKLPFFATVSQGIPSLTQANAHVLSEVSDAEQRECVKAHVLYHGEPAIIPDLDAIEAKLKQVKALY